MTRIAILHPGQMGAAVGRALVEAGHDVGWLPEGRGPGTRRRAEEAGLVALTGVDDRDLVLSVCPPAAAVDTARSVAGFSGLYVDANAVSPETAREVAAVVQVGGATYVDGGIVGPPPAEAGSTRLFLSGSGAAQVAEVFAGSRLEPVVLHGDTAASALKMTYAAWTKTTAALLVSLRGAARQLGVEDALVAEWARSQPDLAARHAGAVAAARDKGWRWEEEMRQIARTFAAAGEPAGFAEAAAEQFARWPRPADG
ncbi:NAD(P)-dependent oxidoreductase [Petropleomorpha daqingensis]|uniref:3-hydroxyisobutyrate dehydrogenase-like beta-hydroxyacid dehydrogenase n=1 Tax=Petropleomorpha daqingensis TaxID=2026353 RepID=A0A853CQR4_9ACTN|nr:NAD(P)-dependent oxidoreductase [Petropleomorpha daqingensis]NYJ08822.1 3-hydroxyisobutyrate dehydrogenase-like beta-hydroxyacid dehydrogenase [Petropleomorpha daqingensis]